MSGDRCVLWLVPGRTPDAELLGALDRKGLLVETAADPYGALGRICAASRSAHSRASVLLFCDPRDLAHAGDVARLAERYAPRAKAWIFDSTARSLRAASSEDFAAWTEPKVQVPSGEVVEPGPGRPPRAVAARMPRPAAHPAAAHRPRAAGGLKLSGTGSLPPLPEIDESQTPDKTAGAAMPDGEPGTSTPAGLLSDEELAMLLSPDDPARQD